MHGWTSLHAASYSAHANIVFILLENDVNVDAKNYDFVSALQFATVKNNMTVVHALLEAGANI